jgi:hypothetical protein
MPTRAKSAATAIASKFFVSLTMTRNRASTNSFCL